MVMIWKGKDLKIIFSSCINAAFRLINFFYRQIFIDHTMGNVNWQIRKSIYLGEVKLEVLHPDHTDYDLNNSSIILLMEYKNTRFLFMRDAEKK